MRHTARITRINDLINHAFPSNMDAWWVNNEPFCSSNTITLHRGIGGDGIDPRAVAALVFGNEPSVSKIVNNCNCTCYTRHTA